MDARLAKDELVPKTDASNDMGNTANSSEDFYSWSPGIFNRLPVAAVLALLISLFCTAAAVAILAESNGQEVSTWSVQPSVYLSLISTVANFLIAFALAEGVTINFWKTALGGSTVGQLHRIWGYGNDIIASVFAGRHLNLVAVACIWATVVGIDGPLLQRASVITSITVTEPTSVIAQIAPIWPPTFLTGFISGRTGNVSIMSPAFSKIMQDFTNRAPITTTIDGCQGVCRLNVNATGLRPECSITQTKFDYYDAVRLLPNGSFNPDEYDLHTAFATNFIINWIYHIPGPYTDLSYSSINMTVLTSAAKYVPGDYAKNISQACPGTLNIRKCVLQPANMSFPITVSNNTVTLDPLPPDSLAYPSTPFFFSDSDLWDTKLPGIAAALSNAYTSAAQFGWGGSVDWILNTQGTLPDNYIEMTEDSWTSFTEYCNVSFRDPTPDLLSSVNEIMFRTAIAAANVPGANETERLLNTQILQATQTSTRTVFHTQWTYVGFTVAIMLIAIAVVTATLYGWWLLGRDMTLGPIDIARSFDAPILTASMNRRHGAADPNADMDLVLKNIGDLRVKYGEVGEANSTEADKLLGPSNPETQLSPGQQSEFRRRGRVLGFGLAEVVKDPSARH